MSKNVLKDKSFNFALKIINLCTTLSRDKTLLILSNQLLKSGTSVGANIEESNQAESKRDFIHKLGIAQKEAFESHYWLRLLTESKLISSDISKELLNDCEEILKILTSSIKTAKSNL